MTALYNRRYTPNGDGPMTGHASKTFDFSQRHSHAARRQQRTRLVLLVGLALALAFCLHSGIIVVQWPGGGAAGRRAAGGGAAAGARRVLRDGTVATDTLVVYIFSNTDPEYIENLRFFAEFGMAEGDGCEYIVVIQEDGQVRRGAVRSCVCALAMGSFWSLGSSWRCCIRLQGCIRWAH